MPQGGYIINTAKQAKVPMISRGWGPAASAELNYTSGVAVDSRGNLYISYYFNHRIGKLMYQENKHGSRYGELWLRGDGGPTFSAMLSYPDGVAVDSSRIHRGRSVR